MNERECEQKVPKTGNHHRQSILKASGRKSIEGYRGTNVTFEAKSGDSGIVEQEMDQKSDLPYIRRSGMLKGSYLELENLNSSLDETHDLEPTDSEKDCI